MLLMIRVDSWDPRGERRERTPKSCPLTSMPVPPTQVIKNTLKEYESPSLSQPSPGDGVHSVQQVTGTRVASFPGKFGTGIQSYFSFLRFLVVLNLVIFLIIFMLVLLPILLTKYKITNSTFVFVPFKDMGEWAS